jgi:hypothetical protein
MASKSTVYGCSALFIAVGGVLFGTNPPSQRYESFAIWEAKDYLVADACPRKLPLVGDSLRDECVTLIQSDASTPLLRSMIRQGTRRRNFGLFSLYRTQLDIETLVPALPRGWVPVYEIEAIGILNTLTIYRAQEKL